MGSGSPPRWELCWMSQANVELQALAVAAVNAGQVPEELLALGFWMENHAFSVTDYTYRGTGGWREWMSDIFEEFAGRARLEIEEIIETTDDFVVARMCVVGTSARSRTPLSLRWVGVTWFRDGKLTCIVGYATRAEALEAARSGPRSGRRGSLTRKLSGCVGE
jgi:hypothetical protein